jgi:hypothetical protein
MAGRRTTNRLHIAYRLLFQRDRILMSNKTINEHLYFYSASAIGWTFNECRHIANAFTLCVTLRLN